MQQAENGSRKRKAEEEEDSPALSHRRTRQRIADITRRAAEKDALEKLAQLVMNSDAKPSKTWKGGASKLSILEHAIEKVQELEAKLAQFTNQAQQNQQAYQHQLPSQQLLHQQNYQPPLPQQQLLQPISSIQNNSLSILSRSHSNFEIKSSNNSLGFDLDPFSQFTLFPFSPPDEKQQQQRSGLLDSAFPPPPPSIHSIFLHNNCMNIVCVKLGEKNFPIIDVSSHLCKRSGFTREELLLSRSPNNFKPIDDTENLVHYYQGFVDSSKNYTWKRTTQLSTKPVFVSSPLTPQSSSTTRQITRTIHEKSSIETVGRTVDRYGNLFHTRFSVFISSSEYLVAFYHDDACIFQGLVLAPEEEEQAPQVHQQFSLTSQVLNPS